MTERSSVVIRDIDGEAEMRAVEGLQKLVWGLPDLDVVPLTHLVAAKAAGGVLLGAFDGQTMAGFAYGFVGREGGVTCLHSHMLAVKPEYRNYNVGRSLKLAQRERALSAGLAHMTWTFDPLQSLNAHFNFAKLGVVSGRYEVNFYGEAASSFLHRAGTDRLWVSWLLDSRRVRRRLEGGAKPESVPPEVEAVAPLVRLGEDGSPRAGDAPGVLSRARAAIEIPGDIGALQRENTGLALEWREATRRAFTEAVAAGYLVEDFYRRTRGGQQLGVYILSRGRTVEDFA